MSRQREQFDKIFGNVDTAVSIADPMLPDRPLVYVNPAFVDLTGYPTSEIIGRNCRFLQGPGTLDETRESIKQSLDTARPITICIRNYKMDGTPFHNLLFMMPFLDDTETPYIIGCQRELSEHEWLRDVKMSTATIEGLQSLSVFNASFNVYERFNLKSRSLISHARSYFLMQKSRQAMLIATNARREE
jgi:PAS domain S-box-containing protein